MSTEPETSNSEVSESAENETTTESTTTETTESSESLISTKEADADQGDADESSAETPEPLTAEDITLPEGFEADEERMTEFLDVYNDASLSPQDKANKLLEFHSAALQAQAEEGVKHFNEMREEWINQAKALPEIGGAKLEDNLTAIDRMVAEVLPEKEEYQAFMQGMQVTGFGCHPMAVKALAIIAERLGEPGPVTRDGRAEAENALSSLYPTMSKG